MNKQIKDRIENLNRELNDIRLNDFYFMENPRFNIIQGELKGINLAVEELEKDTSWHYDCNEENIISGEIPELKGKESLSDKALWDCNSNGVVDIDDVKHHIQKFLKDLKENYEDSNNTEHFIIITRDSLDKLALAHFGNELVSDSHRESGDSRGFGDDLI